MTSLIWPHQITISKSILELDIAKNLSWCLVMNYVIQMVKPGVSYLSDTWSKNSKYKVLTLRESISFLTRRKWSNYLSKEAMPSKYKILKSYKKLKKKFHFKNNISIRLMLCRHSSLMKPTRIWKKLKRLFRSQISKISGRHKGNR